MAELVEELEPLFDYSRVQHSNIVCLEDDDSSDACILIPRKRKNIFNSAVEKVQDTSKVVNIDDGDGDGDGDGDDDLDWLAPPPKVAVNKANISENSTIKEMRLKKQELLSVTESATDVIRRIGEKRDLKATMDDNSFESPIEKPKPLKPAVKRPKIVVSIQDKNDLKPYRIYTDDKFERLFKMYADKANLKVENLVFSFDGVKIDPAKTPSVLDMEDDDIIEVRIK